MDCVFCRRVTAGDFTAANDLAVAFPDATALTPGHTLVISRRHEADFFALARDERIAIWLLADELQTRLAGELRPDGWNVGVNVGDAGGQTVAHAHLHLIPRYAGDVDDPRGGIRWIIPDKARYWQHR